MRAGAPRGELEQPGNSQIAQFAGIQQVVQRFNVSSTGTLGRNSEIPKSDSGEIYDPLD
jgi:hypothetical protein